MRFLNLIEECAGRKSKKNIIRNPLKKEDELTPRIAEACGSFTVEDCLGWIKTFRVILGYTKRTRSLVI
jgi:hypothetical protein